MNINELYDVCTELRKMVDKKSFDEARIYQLSKSLCVNLPNQNCKKCDKLNDYCIILISGAMAKIKKMSENTQSEQKDVKRLLREPYGTYGLRFSNGKTLNNENLTEKSVKWLINNGFDKMLT